MFAKSFVLAALLAFALLSTCSADLVDNQLDDYSRQPAHFSRGHRAIKTCKPCASNQCQVMGMQRYSEPRCEAFGGPGAPCRPFQEAENKTLSLPNALLYCNDVYMQFCPCGPGLTCDLEQAECRHTITLPTAPTRPANNGANWRPSGLSPYERLFTYQQPHRYADNGFGSEPREQIDEDELEDHLPLAVEPLETSFEQQASYSTIRRAPQWAWAVARFH